MPPWWRQAATTGADCFQPISSDRSSSQSRTRRWRSDRFCSSPWPSSAVERSSVFGQRGASKKVPAPAAGASFSAWVINAGHRTSSARGDGGREVHVRHLPIVAVVENDQGLDLGLVPGRRCEVGRQGEVPERDPLRPDRVAQGPGLGRRPRSAAGRRPAGADRWVRRGAGARRSRRRRWRAGRARGRCSRAPGPAPHRPPSAAAALHAS